MATSIGNTVLNCTLHDINVYDQSGKNVVCVYPRSEHQPRLTQEPQRQLSFLDAPGGFQIPVFSAQVFKEVVGLPPDRKADIIVSMPVGQKLAASRE